MKEKYKRISCDFYDILEGYATLKKKVLITYFENDSEIKEEVEIKTLETKDKSEYLISQLGKRIRLDQIISMTEVEK
jgi:Rho-binding antiterminator